MAYGRGGAGNILQAKEEIKKVTQVSARHRAFRRILIAWAHLTTTQDVEANRASTPTAQPTSQPPSEYAHMGRGGSGNWYQPSELQKDGTFTQPTDATAIPTSSKPAISTPWHPEGQELPVARSGRGGAGNFVWKSDEQVRREREGREMDEIKIKESVSKEVERGVEKVLARPGAARLGEDKVGRGW
jgi:hypothetical protein